MEANRFTTALCELVLIVDDVPTAAAFYRDVIGLVPEREHDEAWAWFWAGEPGDPGAGRLALHRGTLLFEEHSPRQEVAMGRRFGPAHFALRVARAKLDAAVAHVRGHDVAVYGPTRFDWMGATSWYFYDPAGNLVEFWSPDE